MVLNQSGVSLYFGCARGVWGLRDAGHGFYVPGGHSFGLGTRLPTDWRPPWLSVDAKLAPRKWDSPRAPELPEGVAALHHKDGWTALSFWDRSGDSRGNSNSNFLFNEVLDFDTALACAKKQFPELFDRFPFEVRPA